MVSEEEMVARMQARLRGEEYQFKEKPITEYPKDFRDFVKNNRQNIIDAQARGKQPFFLANNAKTVNTILGEKVIPETREDKTLVLSIQERADIRHAQRTPKQIQAIQNRWDKHHIEIVKDTFAKIGEKMDEKDIVIEDGYVILSATQARSLHKAQIVRPNHEQLIERNYISTTNSYTINDFCRQNSKHEYEALQGSVATAQNRAFKLSQTNIDTVEALDTTIANNSLPFPIRVVRFNYLAQTENACGISKQTGTFKVDVKDTFNKIQSLGSNADYVDGGFVSVSCDVNNNMMTGREVKMIIDIPAGIPIYITDNYTESEAILGRNTAMTIIDAQLYTYNYPYPGISPTDKISMHLIVKR